MHRYDQDKPAARVHLARIEVDGHESRVSRIFTSGIGRNGGIPRRPAPTLEQIAKDLGWTHAPKELLNEDEGWDGVESGDDGWSIEDSIFPMDVFGDQEKLYAAIKAEYDKINNWSPRRENTQDVITDRREAD